MKRKALLMVLIGAIALCLMGCGEDETAKDTGKKGGTTTSQAPQGEKGVQPVPGGGTAGGTAGGVAGGTAGSTAPGTTGGAAGAGADVLTQQKNEYVQGAEKILTNMEQKLTAWQQQGGAQAQQDQKAQDLTKQTQQQIASARAAVDKLRTATGTQLKDAKVAADQAMQGAEQSFKNLQSYMSESQVTQAQ
jgi:hypothetical protein